MNLYAYYTDFNFAMTRARLTLGYDVDQLNRTASAAKLIAVSPTLSNRSTASGQYQRHAVHGTTSDAVFKAWIGLPLTRKPRAIIEHYQLDQQGSITGVRLEVKYKQ